MGRKYQNINYAIQSTDGTKLSQECIFHFSPFIVPLWGLGLHYLRLSPYFLNVPNSIPHTYLGAKQFALQRETAQLKQGQVHTSFAPKAMDTPPPEPQGSEKGIAATRGNKGAVTAAIPQHLSQSKSKVPQFCLLPCASSGACATRGTDLTANKSFSCQISSLNWSTMWFYKYL